MGIICRLLSNEVDERTATNQNIYIVDKNGSLVSGLDITLSENKKEVTVKAPIEGYKAGETYTLYVTTDVTSNGEPLKQATKMKFTIKKSDDLIAIDSKRVNVAPTIDGVLNESIWGTPVISKTIGYVNKHTGVAESHEMDIYIIHDQNYIYFGATVSNEDFPNGEDRDVIEFYIDANNSGQMEVGEMIKNFWNLDFKNWIREDDSTWGTAVNHDGSEGKATYSNNNYAYEFKIPRNAVENLFAFRVNYREMIYKEDEDRWTFVGEDGFPTQGERFDVEQYQLVRLD